MELSCNSIMAKYSVTLQTATKAFTPHNVRVNPGQGERGELECLAVKKLVSTAARATVTAAAADSWQHPY